ncbi:MAG: triose-phosphate isomerase [Holosporaceae bacterium]|nr:triose-phosphate isomerase [Holosporaceae bacterium]
MKIIIANWKMNGSVNFARKFIREINQVDSQNLVIVCPPAALLDRFSNFRYYIGAQDCFYRKKGSFTGEHSPLLLKEMGCKYAIIGHSERRTNFNETDNIVFKKWKAAIRYGLVPIVCIGESLHDEGNWQGAISQQLKLFPKKLSNGTIFAYEPIGCIGTGVAMSLDRIRTVLEFVRGLLNDERVSLLYGGSVNSQNARQIIDKAGADGILIGKTSLNIQDFKKIILLGNSL